MKMIMYLMVFISLMACNSPSKEITKIKSDQPEWVSDQVKNGVVCSQDRGVYSQSKAENIAINTCLIQLSEKQITGTSEINKTIIVQKMNLTEVVNSNVKTNNTYKVTTSEGSNVLQYDILGKYYDTNLQKVFIWLKTR